MDGLFKNTFKGQRLITSSEPENCNKQFRVSLSKLGQMDVIRHTQKKKKKGRQQFSAYKPMSQQSGLVCVVV